MDDEVERVRVDKFTWERLLLVSALPWETRSVAHVLAIYMSTDGSKARPGTENMVLATRLSERSIRSHLSATVAAGYLKQVERGGFRGPNRIPRASVYAATVPRDIYEMAGRLLNSPPWRNALPAEANMQPTAGSVNMQSTAGSPLTEGSVSGSEPATSASEPATEPSEPAAGFRPSINGSSISPSSINSSNSADFESNGRAKGMPPSRPADLPHQFMEHLDGGKCICGKERRDQVHDPRLRSTARRVYSPNRGAT